MVVLTEGLARAAAWDAGNRHMRKDGREKWNEDDWNTAAKVLEELLSKVKPIITGSPAYATTLSGKCCHVHRIKQKD